ncbi:MAG: FAD-dependent thymidylate synthase [Candidatus Roizmanbacteria bacterium]
MKIRYVALRPTQAHEKRGGIALTPELLAATGARYSRNNEGLDQIVAKIDWANVDKSVDGIFRMVDYGHASIADMAPVAMFIDGVSVFAAYYLWAQSPTGSGQESSTRYIKYSSTSIARPESLGIRNKKSYLAHTKKAFELYEKAAQMWTNLAEKSPELMNLPREVIEDTSEKGVKRLQRMIRNFAFDRARVFLPACALTNLMLTMSARNWVELISLLLSVPYKELNTIGEKMRDELAFATPRLIKHAAYKQETRDVFQQSFEALREYKVTNGADDGAYLRLYEDKKTNLKKYLSNRKNRYSLCGDAVRMMTVKFGWKRIAFAELRDLNRHRTGNKLSIFKPNGFHVAIDQSPNSKMTKELEILSKYPNRLIPQMIQKINKGDFTYVYDYLLGHTMPFEHVTTLEKYIYEAELRTGIGAHYRYAGHMKNTLKVLYRLHPELKGVIFEGSAEPE